MKRILAYSIIFSFFLMAACEEDTGPAPFGCPFAVYQSALVQPGANTTPGYAPDYPCDYAKAKKNGVPWIAHGRTFFTQGSDTLNIAADRNGETLIIRFAFAGTGTYRILPHRQGDYFDDNAFFFTTIGGDVIMDHYTLREEGLVEVVEYNESKNIIRGVFHVSLIDDRTSGAEETILFSDGSFSVHLPE